MGDQRVLRAWAGGLIVALLVTTLIGCGGGGAASAPADEESEAAYASEALDTSYDGALNASTQLVLGTIQLEETGSAATPEQAADLLPLWQALQGGVTAQAEVSAVLKQIEGTMTEEQLGAIAAMQLTQEDLRAWMQEQGLGFAGMGGDMSEEEREALRATRQAAGGMGGGQDGEMPPEMATRRAEFDNMGEEDREALRATMQAGGGFPGGEHGGGGGGGGGGGRQFTFLLRPLIELLEARAEEP